MRDDGKVTDVLHTGSGFNLLKLQWSDFNGQGSIFRVQGCYQGWLIQKKFTDELALPHQHRHPRAIASDQFGALIYIDTSQGKTHLGRERGQLLLHVFTQMTTGAGIDSQLNTHMIIDEATAQAEKNRRQPVAIQTRLFFSSDQVLRIGRYFSTKPAAVIWPVTGQNGRGFEASAASDDNVRLFAQ
jgi:hypothetical protein